MGIEGGQQGCSKGLWGDILLLGTATPFKKVLWLANLRPSSRPEPPWYSSRQSQSTCQYTFPSNTNSHLRIRICGLRCFTFRVLELPTRYSGKQQMIVKRWEYTVASRSISTMLRKVTRQKTESSFPVATRISILIIVYITVLTVTRTSTSKYCMAL
jgi:hypothetical protein